MTNYYVLPLEVDSDFIWCVMETKTEQLIQAFEFEEEAEEYKEFLMDGGAFDGFTPSFVLREVVFSQNINHEFSEFLSE
jgi:hypothetical protein